MPTIPSFLRKPLFYITVSAAFVGALAVARVHAFGADAPAPAKATDRPVLATLVHFAPERPPRTFVATIKPRVEADQAFRVSGKVARRLVDVGRNVAIGEPLATLDEKDLRLQKEQAEAELAASRVAAEQSAADEARGADLRAKGWTAQAVYDRQHAAAEEARGRNRRAQRAVELAQNALEYSTLRADSDGVVTAAMIEPGQVVAPGQAAIRIARKGEKEAAVALPESFVTQARDGEATLTVWAAPERVYPVKLRELSPIADAATRTFAARFSIPDVDDRVALGMSATLVIAAPTAASVARVPLSALFDQGRGPTLWSVAADGALTAKPVKVVRYDGTDALIGAGVEEGERIVVLGVQKLDPAQKVRVISQLSF